MLGCASYQKQMSNVTLGMSKSEFLQTFPKAEYRAAKKYPKGVVEVFELNVSEYHFIPTGAEKRNPLTGMENKVKWFYFYNDQLIQYGEPNDWPESPDTVIEVRNIDARRTGVSF